LIRSETFKIIDEFLRSIVSNLYSFQVIVGELGALKLKGDNFIFLCLAEIVSELD